MLNIDCRKRGPVHHPQWNFAQRSPLFSHVGASRAIPVIPSGGTQLCHEGVYKVESYGASTLTQVLTQTQPNYYLEHIVN